MTGNYEYGATISYLDKLTVDNIGDCYIQANNDFGESYFLVVQTKFGMTRVVQYGPYIDGVAPDKCVYLFSQFQYSENKIDKIIDKFLSSYNITQAREVEYEEISDKFVNPMDYINNWV